jgi:hypothetical protein
LLLPQFKSEFPELLDIKSSLIKYVFEPAAAKVGAGRRSTSSPQLGSCSMYSVYGFHLNRLAVGVVVPAQAD